MQMHSYRGGGAYALTLTSRFRLEATVSSSSPCATYESSTTLNGYDT